MDWEKIDLLLFELEKGQYQNLYSLAERLIPNLTEEDLLQPQDYPELENNPYFRYEEGVLSGIKNVQSALNFLKKNDLQIE